MVEWTLDLERRVGQRPPKGDTTTERVLDVLRRATRHGEGAKALRGRRHRPALARPRAAACQEDVSASMNRIMSMALGDDFDLEFKVNATRTLGHVWFSALIGWVNGWSGMEKVADELDVATHLVLDQYGS